MVEQKKHRINYMEGDPRSVEGFRSALKAGVAVDICAREQNQAVKAPFVSGVNHQMVMAEGVVVITASSTNPDAAVEAFGNLRTAIGK